SLCILCDSTIASAFLFYSSPHLLVLLSFPTRRSSDLEEVCVFLRALLRHLRGPIIALLDNSTTHKGEPLEKLRRQHPRLTIEHRSEEHTSELQSRENLVCRLLLEKKKKKRRNQLDPEA